MNKFLSEFIGTFFLVFAGTGAIIVNDISGGQITHIGIALTFGLIVMAMIYSIGNISGAHLNPAVTLGFVVSGRLNMNQALPYIMSQVFGALTASFLLWILFPHHVGLGATVPSGSLFQSFALEFVLSFLLMFVILNVSTGAMEKGIMAGVAVGSTIALEALFAGPISGASMNPARSLAPALMSGQWTGLWIYVSAPFLGALAACPFCRLIQGVDCCPLEKSDPYPQSN